MTEVSYPIATTENLVKSNSGVLRITNDGTKLLANLGAQYVINVAAAARQVAEHGGRKTVSAGDIELVVGLIDGE